MLVIKNKEMEECHFSLLGIGDTFILEGIPFIKISKNCEFANAISLVPYEEEYLHTIGADDYVAIADFSVEIERKKEKTNER